MYFDKKTTQTVLFEINISHVSIIEKQCISIVPEQNCNYLSILSYGGYGGVIQISKPYRILIDVQS